MITNSAPLGRAPAPSTVADADCGIDPADLTLVYLNALRAVGVSAAAMSTSRAHTVFESAVRGCSWPDMWAGGHYRAAAVLRRAWKAAPKDLAQVIVAVLADRGQLSRIDAQVQSWVNRHSLTPLTQTRPKEHSS